jgi:hypothetical protein
MAKKAKEKTFERSEPYFTISILKSISEPAREQTTYVLCIVVVVGRLTVLVDDGQFAFLGRDEDGVGLLQRDALVRSHLQKVYFKLKAATFNPAAFDHTNHKSEAETYH